MQVFINLPVNDLNASKAFFEALGFSFNPQFTSETGACMVLSEHNFVMLLTKPFFAGFTPNPQPDPKATTGLLVALSLSGKAAVDEMLLKGAAAGGREHRAVQDLGFMYSRALEDLDGHVWELFHMDMSAMPLGE